MSDRFDEQARELWDVIREYADGLPKDAATMFPRDRIAAALREAAQPQWRSLDVPPKEGTWVMVATRVGVTIVKWIDSMAMPGSPYIAWMPEQKPHKVMP